MPTSTDLSRALPAFAAAPAAATDMALAAAQRAVVLQIELFDRLIGLAIARSRQAADDPPGAFRDALLAPAVVETAWRFTSGWVAIGRDTVVSMVSLATAHARGAAGEVDHLSRDARDANARCAADAATAASVALTHGLAELGRLADVATRLALHPATDGPMRAVGDLAVGAGDAAESATQSAARRAVDATVAAFRESGPATRRDTGSAVAATRAAAAAVGASGGAAAAIEGAPGRARGPARDRSGDRAPAARGGRAGRTRKASR